MLLWILSSAGYLDTWAWGSAVFGISCPIGRNFSLIAVAHCEQHLFGEIQVTALFTVVFKNMGLDNRVDRAGFLTEAAKNAFGQVDVIARGAAAAVVPYVRFNRDRQCRANRLAEFAGNAALFAVFIAAQRVQAPEARAKRGFFFGKLDGDLAAEHVLAG